MEKQSFPFVNTPILTTEQLSKWAELFLPTGVIDIGDASVDLNKLKVYADSTGMQVKVKTGKAFMKGHLFWGKTSEEVLAIADADPTNDRIDRVVVQLTWATGVIDLVIKTGTPGASPLPPTLTTDTAIWEISLAQVLVDSAASTIVAGKVTDERTFVGPLSISQVVGKQKIWIPASAIRPKETNGCAAVEGHETTSGRPDIIHLAFDNTTEEHGQFQIDFPKGWNKGTITYDAKWTGIAAGAGGVAWGLQAVACSDDDTIDVAPGTAVIITDTFLAVEDMHRTSESAALTIGGTPEEGDTVFFDIFRKVSDAADTRAADSNLLGINLYFTTESPTDD